MKKEDVSRSLRFPTSGASVEGGSEQMKKEVGHFETYCNAFLIICEIHIVVFDVFLLIQINVEQIYAKHSDEKTKRRSCLLYTSPSPRDKRQSRMPSSA